MYETFHEEVCKACLGSGIQNNRLTGMNELCPVCHGRGKRHVSNMEGLPPGVYCSTQQGGTTCI